MFIKTYFHNLQPKTKSWTQKSMSCKNAHLPIKLFPIPAQTKTLFMAFRWFACRFHLWRLSQTVCPNPFCNFSLSKWIKYKTCTIRALFCRWVVCNKKEKEVLNVWSFRVLDYSHRVEFWNWNIQEFVVAFNKAIPQNLLGKG